jgi:peroxiredoxin
MRSNRNPKTEVKLRHPQGARPSGRFNVHLANGSNTHQTMPTVRRRERRAPAIRLGWQAFLTSVFGINSFQSLSVIAFLCLSSVPALPADPVRESDHPPSGEVLNFAMLDHRGRLHELRRLGGQAVVLFFTANDCPVARQSASKLRAIREKFSERGVAVLMVNASAADDRSSISREAVRLGVWHVPVLKDDTQGVARHLGVQRTGETIAISTKDWTVFYRGAIDDQLVEGAQKPQPTERYLETALNEFLSAQPVSRPKTVARGCVIQFESGDGPETAPVSYAKDVVPILERKCIHCHSPGNIGSWSMSGFKKVKSMAAMIEEVLLTRRMPPWDADPHIGKFSNDSTLTTAESQTLLRWVHQGALRGDGPDPLETSVRPPAKEWPLGPPDIVLRLAQPQQIPATGVLDYRHIEVVATNATEGWVSAVWVKPGNKQVLHHVIARLKDKGQRNHLGENEMFAGWAPGATQGGLPQGSGKFLPKNARFDFELHYTPNGVPQTDQTEIGLYLLPEKPLARFESVPVVNTTFEITPDDPDSQTSAMYGFKRDATLYSLTPHMHLRGKWMKFEALFPDGRRETLCSVPRYDFNWQQTYVLAQPRKLPAGTWVLVSGGYDNSPRNPSNPDPKKTVHWGDQSFDEMFLGWYNVAWDLEPPKQVSVNR